MASERRAESHDLGYISRFRGTVFQTLTRAASLVGVVALALLLVFITIDAVRPTTADPAWYAVVVATFVLPTLLFAAYSRRHSAVGAVAVRACGATVGGAALATVLIIWLGDQLGPLTLIGVIVPTLVVGAVLARGREALGVGLQTAGVAAAGATVATVGALFLGAQATLVYAVALGVPMAALGWFFLSRPAIGSVGAHAIIWAAIAAALTSVVVEIGSAFAGVRLGETALAVYALGAMVGVLGYAIYARAYRDGGIVGLLAPFVPLAAVLAGYLFHREFVITTPVTPLLYLALVGVPTIAVAARTLSRGGRGRIGVVLPLVPVVGAAAVVAFHNRFLLTGPTVLGTFGLAIGLSFGVYAWRLDTRRGADADSTPGTSVDSSDGGATAHSEGRLGLLAPLVVFGGLLAGLLGARAFGIAGPQTWLDVQFLLSDSHYEAALAGLHPALIGSLYVGLMVAILSFPVGVGAAIYLEEYAPENRWTRLLEVNIGNLAGVPSVVYGLLGVGVFVRYAGLPLGALIVGGFTLSLLILPIVIISAQEAIRAVPDSLRQASYGMGSTRWQTIRNVVLPEALPGILTGTILALGRAVGETAPLLMVGYAAVSGVPDSLTGQGTAMPLQVFSWARDAQPLFRENLAAAGALTMLIVMLAMNGIAILIRNKYQTQS